MKVLGKSVSVLIIALFAFAFAYMFTVITRVHQKYDSEYISEMLKSSLEVYVPTVSAESLPNLAMSLNNVEYVPASATTVSLPVKQLTAATDTCDLLGRRMSRGYKGVRIVNGRKVIKR